MVTTQLLSDEFISNYPEQPDHMSELGAFVYYRTYSRWREEDKRRETWKETVRRSVEYNVSIALKEMSKYRANENKLDAVRVEAETLFDNIFNLRQFLSGRTHWIGGAESGVAEKFPLANFNCSFINIKHMSEEQNDLADLFYLLLVGTGVGFKITKDFAANLPPIRTNFNLIHSEYKPLIADERIDDTQLHIMPNGYAKIWVGDSKEGWVQALKYFFDLLIQPKHEAVHTIKISYNSIRPMGERLKTFGGTASGHLPLMEMFEGFKNVLMNNIDSNLAPLDKQILHHSWGDEDTGYAYLRPIHILDMANLIGNNVVVGGVRRTAEIALFDSDDWECILAKYGINGIWDATHHYNVCEKLERMDILPDWMKNMETANANARPLHHRRMSNNSIAFTSKPTREMLNLIFTIMQGEGEPGFVNMEEANRRRPDAEGLNPCAEILLDSYGVCNLTTVNVDAFITRIDLHDGTLDHYELDIPGLLQAQALSARAGIRMTCVDLELPHWDRVQKRDRLIGTSLTGWQDAMGKLGWDEGMQDKLLNMLQDVVRQEGVRYSHILRIPTPLLDTTVKPEGTLSQVAGGVSSGLHVSHAPFFIRRIRINAHDPLATVAKALNWTVHPEVGQDASNPRTLVIDFPVASGATHTKSDQTVKGQFDTYFRFQDFYTAHNSSNTISVKPDEWGDAEEIVFKNWDNFVGVSFLADDGGSYKLAPYEEITEEQYNTLKESMKPFDASLLRYLEGDEVSELTDESCSAGACAVR